MNGPLALGDLSFVIFGEQARKIPGDTSVHLPTFKDRDGSWRPAVRLPEELRRPSADAVREFLVESGLAHLERQRKERSA